MSKASFLIDEKTKSTALKKAQKDGMSLSSVVEILLREYSKGKIRITTSLIKKGKRDENGFTQKEVKEILKAKKDADEGKNITSGPFTTFEEVENHLDGLM